MTVELKEFVARTLQDILEGVLASQEHKQVGTNVATWGVGSAKFQADSGVTQAVNGWMTVVRFDVAVTAETSDAVKGGGGIKVAVLSLGAEVGTSERSTAATRVQFTIPVLLPAGDRIRPEGAAGE